MVTQLTQKVYTPEEYLELESEAKIRHELINGEMIPMAGGTTRHNEIVTNLCVFLKPSLRQQGRRLYSENVRLWIPANEVFTYPDLMILDGDPIYYENTQTTVTNPVVIIEVLSESTRDYDQGRKFGFYRSLEMLQDYVLVDQEQCSVMVYRRGNRKEWNLQISEDLTEVIELESLGVKIPLEDIYEGIF
ncbi:MAG: Uma2 family endonuclease [Cyanobacteria bacterium]|jgi:Uma2 family endonuclease|nr:Uma2 family endonuclease [Cyanobacteria bacterium GSL.Bin1]